MNNSIENREKVDVYKKTPMQFFLSELGIYITQVIIFLIIAFISSKFLTAENGLAEYALSKISTTAFFEIGYFVVAVILVFGCIFIMVTLAEQSTLEIQRHVKVILIEIPRMMFILSASMAGSYLMVIIFITLGNAGEAARAELKIVKVLNFFTTTTFLFICATFLNYVLLKKTHILNKTVIPKIIKGEE